MATVDAGVVSASPSARALPTTAGSAASPVVPATGGRGPDSAALRERDAASIQAELSGKTGTVKDHCWPRARGREESDATVTRIQVTLQLLPDGAVDVVSVTKDPPGHSGLARCIADSVGAWKFTPNPQKTSLTVVFMFSGR
jgi:hypothetical protein